MRTSVRSKQFRRDVERAGQRGKDLIKLRELLSLLVTGQELPQRYQDPSLKGVWRGIA
ncbi:MAG: type II toxin-antitoxin system mRNA interferase toxin, RelE/StbE family, partial [Acidimicrobiales bacterium]